MLRPILSMESFEWFVNMADIFFNLTSSKVTGRKLKGRQPMIKLLIYSNATPEMNGPRRTFDDNVTFISRYVYHNIVSTKM